MTVHNGHRLVLVIEWQPSLTIAILGGRLTTHALVTRPARICTQQYMFIPINLHDTLTLITIARVEGHDGNRGITRCDVGVRKVEGMNWGL